MIQAVSILLIGYSVFSALLMVLLHFNSRNYSLQSASLFLGIAVMLVLGLMQGFHFAYLQYADESLHGPVYRALLFSVAPLFFLFARPLLKPQTRLTTVDLLHVLPVIIAVFLRHDLALPLAFIVGVFYLLALARLVYALRARRERFRFELGLLATIFVLGILVAAAGMSITLLGEVLFYSLYAIAIGAAFLLVTIMLFMAPRLPAEVVEAARETYAVSTLMNVDCDKVIEQLAGLMRDERLYTIPDLDLQGLARRVELNTHQLSELINTRMGKNFPRYLREHRVAAARSMLVDESSASVLSVGLAVGFNSQSVFYEAFREITGMTPGKYRQLHTRQTTK